MSYPRANPLTDRKKRYEHHVRKKFAEKGVSPSPAQVQKSVKDLSIKQAKARRKVKEAKVKKAQKTAKEAVKKKISENRAIEKANKETQRGRERAAKSAETAARKHEWEKRIRAGELAYGTHVARQLFNAVVTQPLSRLSSMGDLRLTGKK